jgi:uncharacterized membrane protein
MQQLKSSLFFKVEMVMIGTFRIEFAVTKETSVIAIQVLLYCHFLFTYSTYDGFGGIINFLPYFHRMISGFLMTMITWIILIATFKFYGNYIQRRMIMFTTGLVINNFAFYYYAIRRTHRSKIDFIWKLYLNFQTHLSFYFFSPYLHKNIFHS